MSVNTLSDQVEFTYKTPKITSIWLFLILIFCTACAHQYTIKTTKYQAETSFGKRHGCKPPAFVLSHKWPLGLDIVRRGFRAGRQGRLLALFGYYFGELGPTVELTILGGTGYVTMDPENVETILGTGFDDWNLGRRKEAMMAMIGDGIFTQDGNQWKRSRELLRRNFVGMQYQNFEGFREHTENMIKGLRDSAGIVDLQPFFYRLTLDTTIAMILGQSVESFRHELGDLFSRSFDRASAVTAQRLRLGDVYWAYVPKGFLTACQTIKRYTEQCVKDALQRERDNERKSDKYTFIHDLYTEYQDVRLVRDQVINVLIAGRDTTATKMSYVFRLLLRHPDVLEKLRGEVTSVLGDEKDITRAHIQRMPYLHIVLKETLRLYPPVPLNTRFYKQGTFCLAVEAQTVFPQCWFARETWEDLGAERQHLTIVLSNADGCKVLLD